MGGDARREGSPLFYETQRFPHRRVPLVVGGVLVVTLAGAVAGDAEPAFTIAVGVFVAVLGLLYVARLTTEVRPDGVHVRLFPAHLSARHVPAWRIEEVEALPEGIVGRFGGKGLRWHPDHGWAYLVGGSGGVRLERAGDPTLYVGSERPDELATAIRHASETAGSEQ